MKVLLILVLLTIFSTASATGFQRTGSGFCRSEINPKKYLNSILKDNTNNAQCKAKCESSVYCTGYAFAPTLYNGRCYNYGCPKLTSGLTEVSNYHANTRNWMAASGEMEDISSNYKSTANNNDATCYKKLYTECVRGVFNKKVCMCGRILAQNGDTCVKDDTVSRGKPVTSCAENGDKQVSTTCKCGDQKHDCKGYCYENELGGLKCHGYPICHQFTPTASKMTKCLCGDEMCVKGQFCEIKLSDADPDAYCANEPRDTGCAESGNFQVSKDCKCGDQKHDCKAGKGYCYENEVGGLKCHGYPICHQFTPTASKMTKCLCGDEMCVKGQYCEIKLSDADPDQYCANEPRENESNPWGSSCQEMSNFYGAIAGKTWGCAPANAQKWWKAQPCNTRPQVSTYCGCKGGCKAPATGFQKIGGGFCRSGINPKKYLNSILKDNTNNAQCKAKCESSVYCTGYAFAPTLYNGRCYNYGCPKLTSGLTEVTNYDANTKTWMAASGEMEDISGIAGVTNNNDATCYKKLYAECVRGVVNKKVCMCGRILAQHGDTCVKDDTISRGKPACTKERATEACACGDKVTCKKGLFCHGLDNPYYKQCKREQEGATTKAPVKKEQCTKEKATSPCLCGISGLITCKKGLYCHGELTGKSYFNQCRKEPEVIDTGEEVCLAGSTEMASDKLCDSSARQDLGFTGTDNPDDCGKLSMEDDRCHKTDGVAYFDFNPGYNGQCKCASDDKCSNGLYTDHGGYDVYSYKCPGGNTCAPMKNEKKCHKDKKCLWNRTKKKCGSAKHPFCKIGEKGSADCFCGRRGLVRGCPYTTM